MREAISTRPGAKQYTRESRSERSARRARGVRSMRLFYFYLASMWGFATGAAGYAIARTLTTGEPFAPTMGLLVGLLPFAGFAIAGGAIAAVAYREARHRNR